MTISVNSKKKQVKKVRREPAVAGSLILVNSRFVRSGFQTVRGSRPCLRCAFGVGILLVLVSEMDLYPDMV